MQDVLIVTGTVKSAPGSTCWLIHLRPDAKTIYLAARSQDAKDGEESSLSDVRFELPIIIITIIINKASRITTQSNN